MAISNVFGAGATLLATQKPAAGGTNSTALSADTPADFAALLKEQGNASGTVNARQTASDSQKNETGVAKSPKEEFLAWAHMSWEERFIAAALYRRGLTQEEFDALPLEEQQKIMNEIREELRRYVEDSAKNHELAGESADAQDGPLAVDTQTAEVLPASVSLVGNAALLKEFDALLDQPDPQDRKHIK